jgi:hypothetical protein
MKHYLKFSDAYALEKQGVIIHEDANGIPYAEMEAFEPWSNDDFFEDKITLAETNAWNSFIQGKKEIKVVLEEVNFDDIQDSYYDRLILTIGGCEYEEKDEYTYVYYTYNKLVSGFLTKKFEPFIDINRCKLNNDHPTVLDGVTIKFMEE